jgi:hypothetical protein
MPRQRVSHIAGIRQYGSNTRGGPGVCVSPPDPAIRVWVWVHTVPCCSLLQVFVFQFLFFFIFLSPTNPMQRCIASINALRARVATPVWPFGKRLHSRYRHSHRCNLPNWSHTVGIRQYGSDAWVAPSLRPTSWHHSYRQHSRRRAPNSIRGLKPPLSGPVLDGRCDRTHRL